MPTRPIALSILLGMLAARAAVARQESPALHEAESSTPPAGADEQSFKIVDPTGDDARAKRHPLARVEIVRDVVYATAPSDDGRTIELLMDVVFPKLSGPNPLPAVVYIHGGGYRGGSREIGLRQAIGFALGGYFAATIDYRLSGDAKYPAAVHDCKAAIRFLRANAAELVIDRDRIGVWGHSAGGHLSALLAVSGGVQPLEGSIGPVDASSAVQCAVSVSGPADFTGITERARDLGGWFGGVPEQRAAQLREASPVTHIDPADPPILIVHGTEDRIVPMRQSILLDEALGRAGVKHELIQVEGAGHVIADAQTLQRIAGFFDEHLGGHARASFEALEELDDEERDWLQRRLREDRRSPPPPAETPPPR
jgi:acetyl esterase/lipase